MHLRFNLYRHPCITWPLLVSDQGGLLSQLPFLQRVSADRRNCPWLPNQEEKTFLEALDRTGMSIKLIPKKKKGCTTKVLFFLFCKKSQILYERLSRVFYCDFTKGLTTTAENPKQDGGQHSHQIYQPARLPNNGNGGIYEDSESRPFQNYQPRQNLN